MDLLFAVDVVTVAVSSLLLVLGLVLKLFISKRSSDISTLDDKNCQTVMLVKLGPNVKLECFGN